MKPHFLTIFILAVSICNVFGSNKYEQITNSEGLSNSAINVIAQDSSGIMWFGTWDGLNSYDGKDIRVYKPESGNPKSISNNIIRDIVEQRKGIIWVVTDHGINRFETPQNVFTPFYFGYENNYPPDWGTYNIAKTADNTIFSSVRGESLSFYSETEKCFFLINSPRLNTRNIKKMGADKKNRLWVVHTNGAVNIVEWKQTSNNNVSITDVVNLPLPSIKHMRQKDDYIILVDWDNRVYVYDSEHESRIFEFDPQKANLDINIEIADIIDNTLQLAVSSGSYYSMPIDSTAVPAFNNYLKNISVKAFYKCKQNILWIGTDGYSIYKNYDKNIHFNTIRLKKEMDIVRAFCEDDENRLWVGTKGGGIAVIENQNGPDFKVVAEYNTANGLNNNSVYSIAKGFGSTLFIGTDGDGLNVYSNGRLSKLKMRNIQFFHTYAIYCSEKDSTLWVGTAGRGLIKLKISRKNGGFEVTEHKQYQYDRNNPNSISHNVVYSVLPGDGNFLWVGTRGGGLNYFDIENEKFSACRYDVEKPTTINSSDVLCLHKDADGKLWIGTSAGLNSLNKIEGGELEFTRYNQSNGLANNTVHGILEDSENNLWLSTNKGIARFNKKDGRINSFVEQNGLQSNEFSDGAYYKSDFNNHLFFGGISGFNSFDPDKIHLSNYIPDFYISSFKLRNDEKNIYERIRKNKKGQSELVLAYNENFFSFNIQALDYMQNKNCEYKYKLEGIDNDWVYNGNLGYLSYTNIPPGKYTLAIDYTNSDKVWVENPYELLITIKNPYWKTPVAYSIYFLLIAAALWFVYWLTQRNIARKREMLIEKMQAKEKENIHEAKLRFFTNIAHEFCTPLTLISGPCERILAQPDVDKFTAGYVQMIQANAERLNNLIRELIEFRRIETGNRELLIEPLQITNLTYDILNLFTDVADSRGIHITFFTKKSIEWNSDKGFLVTIITNLISNAFKYTPAGKKINIELSIENDQLQIKIANQANNPINEKDYKRMFDRYTILDNFENQEYNQTFSRNGLGLAISYNMAELLDGTIDGKNLPDSFVQFTVMLPRIATNTESSASTSSLVYTPAVEQVKNIKLPEYEFDKMKSTILIIDDEIEILWFISELFSEKYNVITTSDPLKIESILAEYSPNIIISDVVMPKLNGIELTKKIKSKESTAHIPVVLVSGKYEIEEQIEALGAGAEMYITKPFNAEHLKVSVEQIIGRKEKLKDYFSSPISSYELAEGKLTHKEHKKFLQSVLEIINKNITNNDLSTQFIADELGMGSRSFYRKMEEIGEESPTRLIKECRLHIAKDLLTKSKLTINEIVFKSGFSNKASFFKAFSKKFGCTPGEFRAKYEEEMKKN